MPSDQIFVGSITILLAAAAFVVGWGHWSAPYNLMLPAKIQNRHGKRAARAFYVLLGVVLLVAGLVIISGIRPSFAVPQPDQNARPEPDLR